MSLKVRIFYNEKEDKNLKKKEIFKKTNDEIIKLWKTNKTVNFEIEKLNIVIGTTSQLRGKHLTDCIPVCIDKDIVVGPVLTEGNNCFDCFMQQRMNRDNVNNKADVEGLTVDEISHQVSQCLELLIDNEDDETNYYLIKKKLGILLHNFHRFVKCPYCDYGFERDQNIKTKHILDLEKCDTSTDFDVNRVLKLVQENDSGIAFNTKKVKNNSRYLTRMWAYSNNEVYPVDGLGISFENQNKANENALFEMIERYSGTTSIDDIYGSMYELTANKINFLNPNSLTWLKMSNHLYESSQSEEIKWKLSFNFTKERAEMLPSFLASYSLDKEKEGIIASSNGFAAGTALHEAIKNGLFELIERDSFLFYWIHKKKPIEIFNNSIELPSCTKIIKFLEKRGYIVHIYDITLESKIPVIWILCEGTRDDNFSYYSTCGSGEETDIALMSALKESLFALQKYKKDIAHIKSVAQRMQCEEVKTVADHPIFYADGARNKEFEFLKGSMRKKWKNSKIPSTLDWIKKQVEKNYGDIYVANVSSRGMAQNHIYVVKVFVPGLQEMYFGYKNQFLNTKRINNRGGKVYWPTIHPFP